MGLAARIGLRSALAAVSLTTAFVVSPVSAGEMSSNETDQEFCTYYSEDFQSPPGDEWSYTTTSAVPADANRRFLGQLTNQSVSLNLTDLPTHDAVRVTFDFYGILSLDGDSGYGNERFTLSATEGPTLLDTTFSNYYGATQDYPGAYNTQASYPAQTGAEERNTLGYMWGSDQMNSVYELGGDAEGVFAHTASSLQLNFAMSNLQEITDESWGIDNVIVELAGCEDAPEPRPQWALTVARYGDSGGTVEGPGINCGRDCNESYDPDTTVELTAIPAPGFEFSGWSGDCSGAMALCSLQMTGPRDVTATFVPAGPEPEPEPDSDEDGVTDDSDNCRDTVNPDQSDVDGDGVGDVCDPTDDSEIVLDTGPCAGYAVDSRTALPGGGEVVVGTQASDELVGTSAADLICGLGGGDKIRGGAGRDDIFGGRGNDVVRGGSSNDTLRGNRGNDALYGGRGRNDSCAGGPGADSRTGCEG